MFWNHVNKKLSAHLHGELSQDEARRVTEHLLGCRRCRAEFEEIKFGAQMAAQLVRCQAPDSLWGELERAMSAGISSHREGAKSAEAARGRSLFATPAFGFAAVAAILLIGFAAFW